MPDISLATMDSLRNMKTFRQELSTKRRKINWSHLIGTTPEVGVRISAPNKSRVSSTNKIKQISARISSLAIRIH